MWPVADILKSPWNQPTKKNREQNKQTWKCINWISVSVENQNTCTFSAKRKNSAYTEQSSARNSDKEFKEAFWCRQGASGNDKTFTLSLFQCMWRLLAPVTEQHCLTVFFIHCPSALPVSLIVLDPQRTTVDLWGATTQFWGALYLTGGKNMFHSYFSVFFGCLCLCTHQLDMRE